MFIFDIDLYEVFKKDFIYLFLKRGERKEKGKKRNINVWLPLMHPLLGTWPATQACALTGYCTGDPLVNRLSLSPLTHTSQGDLYEVLLVKKHSYIRKLKVLCHIGGFLISWTG